MAPTFLRESLVQPSGAVEKSALQAPSLRLAGLPEGRLKRLGRFLHTVAHPEPRGMVALAEVLPWLMPKVRPRFEYETFNMKTGQPTPEFRPLAGAFAVSLVVDMPNQDLDVGVAELQAWQVDFDLLMQQARTNLLARSGANGFQDLGRGRFRSIWRDNLDGSRLLLPGIISRLPVQGDPVAVLPNRNTLLVVGSADPEGLRWALEGASRDLNEDLGLLNGSPLRLRHFHWEPFQAPEADPVAALLARIEQRRLNHDYGQQKVLLDERNQWQGKTVAVAPYQLETLPAGAATSFTIWPQTASEVWLPEVDRISLAWEPGAVQGRASLPWQAARQRLSHLLEPVGLFPERYRFQPLPQADQLERMLA